MDEKNKEFVALKKWDGKQYGLFFGVLAVWIVFTAVVLKLAPMIAFLCVLGLLALYYMYNTFKAEYAYTISSHFTVEILKKGGKRKSVAEFFMADMTLCAPLERDEYKERIAQCEKTVNAATDKKLPGTYFAIFERDNSKTALLFTPTEMMLNEIDRHTSHKSIR